MCWLRSWVMMAAGARKDVLMNQMITRQNRLFTREAEERREIEGLARVLQTTDRILSGRDLIVRLAGAPSTGTYMDSVGAWTDGIDIWLNEGEIGKARDRVDSIEQMVAAVKGLNYHELAHILFSPRMDGSLAENVRKAGTAVGDVQNMWWCYNVLEDQKVEMLFGKRYRLAYSYFKHVNLDFIINADKQDFNSLLLLEHGRLFLPKELRSKLFSMYADAHGLRAATEIGGIIEEYITLNTQTTVGVAKALELVKKMFLLLPKDDKGSRETPEAGASHMEPSESYNSDEKQDGPEYDGQHTSGTPDELDEDDLEDLKGDYEADKEPKESDSESQDGDGDAGESDSEDDGDEEGEGGSASPGITNKSQVPNKSEADPNLSNTIDGIKEDAAHAQAEEMDSQPKFKDDIDRTAEALGSGVQAGNYSDKKMGSYVEFPVTGDMYSHQPKVLNTLRKLRLDVEPMWHTRQESGSVNAERAMLSERNMELDVFDLWDEGSEEEGGIEVALLLDLSSSMFSLIYGGSNEPYYGTLQKDAEAGLREPPVDTPIVAASQAIWMLKRTMDAMDVPVTVLGYNTEWSVLYTQDERASLTSYRLFDADGGTSPSSCLKEAMNVLGRSRMKNRVLVTVTDGAWASQDKFYSYRGDEDYSVDVWVKNVKMQGVTTMLLGIGKAVERFGTHNFELATDLENVSDIADTVEELVKSIMLKALRNRDDLG